ncbi:hypothetical protein DJ568_03560 [Mucilaginibacter hurinus]|uniref:Uncharacterized protein n=1 Tax=Mucilaginibacter hurinus TaxID=2201324 RepID=A0A367GRW6_9SPHI|nr:hypothetical protein [Mucilaginibacter hurinus]RCH55845.1 hypothetical protein DJ568_03560 [Mucilaginibacter hurinus]
MRERLTLFFLVFFINQVTFAQHTDESTNTKQLKIYSDSLSTLGNMFINHADEFERKNANYRFIKTLVSALKTPNSYNFSFDSVKAVSIIKSPDNRFRIFTWHVLNDDGSYRFYGTVQMNTGGPLKMHPLEDYSPLFKNPEDSVTTNIKWYGAQYYKIVPVTGNSPYYVLLGWKGHTPKSTKKVIDVLSFKNDKAELGAPVFDGNGKNRKRVIFEYARQASMLLKYVPDENLIVFDHLSPPDRKSADKPETFGPDLSYDGYQLKNGRWHYVENLDMRNIPEERDAEYVDPEKEAVEARRLIPRKN